MAVYSYKCPNCSASLHYNPNLEKLSCEYCHSEFSRQEIDKYLQNNPDNIISENKEVVYKGYNCSNCAAEVITDDTTLTTFCYYCHSPVVLTDRISGDYKIDKVIPFKIAKEDATNNFLKWAKSKRYIQKEFYSNSQLEKITGLYLPYWSVDYKYYMNLHASGEKTNTNILGSREEVVTNIYDITRKGDIEIDHIHELAYSKIDKNLIDSISPYNMKEIKEFSPYYLNGFFSEIKNIEMSEVEPKINNRIENYKHNLYSHIVSGYSSLKVHTNIQRELQKKWNSLLLPTWMLTYDYNDKKYIFAMNGQTGKIFGEVPIDKMRVLFDSAIFGSVITALLLIGGYFLW